MTMCIALILLLCLIGIKLSKKDFFESYMGKDETLPIKGIFVLLIFASHFVGYVKLDMGGV